MLKLKKIASLLCTIAIAAATIVMPINASAEGTFSFGVKSGKTAYGGNAIAGYNTSVILTVDGLFTSMEDFKTTASGRFVFFVTKGALKSGVNCVTLGSDGLFGVVNSADVSYQPSVTAIEGNDEYDRLTVMYYGTDAYTTMTNDIVELKLNFNSKTDIPDLEIIPDPSLSYITLCEMDATATPTDTIDTFADMDYTYTVASGTNTVVKTANSQGGGEEDDDEVEFEEFVGVKEDGVTPDGSVAIATKTTFTAEDGVNEILWTVTPANSENKARTHLSTIDVDGGAEYTLGMVINGLAAEWISAITAVLQ